METANIAVTGDFYPKFLQNACSSANMLALLETKGYSAMASCVIEHIITNPELKESERLYYVLADLYANYNRSQNEQRSCTIPGIIWEERLNLREEYVFVLQKSLEAKGYFAIQRGVCNNQNEINVITPTLPAHVIESLQSAINRNNPRLDDKDNNVRSLLDDTKLFVKFNNKQIEVLIQNETISPLQKLIWIFLYLRSNCSYQASGDWRSTITQAELSQIFKCSQSTASKALTQLEDAGFIAKSQYKAIDTTSCSNRRKKSVWFIEAVFPSNNMHALLQQRTRANINSDYQHASQVSQAVDNIEFIPTVKGEYSHRSGEYSLGSGQYSQSSVSSIKDITTKSILIKNNKQQTSTSPNVIDVFINQKNRALEINTPQDFNPQSLMDADIVEQKYQQNVRKLTPEQVLKAMNFAKKLKRSGLASIDLQDVSELELARQFIHHAANYKMTKLGCKNRDEEVEAALSFAWTAATSGRWRCPTGWGDAIDLHLEREKYRYEDPAAAIVSKFKTKVTRYLYN